jgi:hypothetical protein
MLPIYDSCPLKGKVEPLIHSQSLHIGDTFQKLSIPLQVPHGSVTSKGSQKPIRADFATQRGPSQTHARQSSCPSPLRVFPKKLAATYGTVQLTILKAACF